MARRPKAKPTNESSVETWMLVSNDNDSETASDKGDLGKLELWVEIRKQVKILREGIEDEPSV
jgi:transitional endoplasmic reticulum ATPase